VHIELVYHALDEESNPTTTSTPLTSLEKVITSNMNGVRHMALKSFLREDVIIRGILQVTVIRAENLIPSDLNHQCDPYVVLRMKKSDARKTTKVRKSAFILWVFDMVSNLYCLFLFSC
jgi:Ca2+-dependent lipid-binding protein